MSSPESWGALSSLASAEPRLEFHDATVVEAEDPAHDATDASTRPKRVWVTLFSPEGPPALAEKFRARLDAVCSNPRIDGVLDAGSADDGTQWVMTRSHRGSTLGDHLRAGVRLTDDELVGLAATLGATVAHAHRHDVVHGLLDPSRLGVTRSWEIGAVSDFGLAALGDDVFHVAGDTEFVAPELLTIDLDNGATPAPTVAADIHSIARILDAVRSMESTPALDPVLAKAWSTDAADRHSSVDEFIGDVDQALSDTDALDDTDALGDTDTRNDTDALSGTDAFNNTEAPATTAAPATAVIDDAAHPFGSPATRPADSSVSAVGPTSRRGLPLGAIAAAIGVVAIIGLIAWLVTRGGDDNTDVATTDTDVELTIDDDVDQSANDASDDSGGVAPAIIGTDVVADAGDEDAGAAIAEAAAEQAADANAAEPATEAPDPATSDESAPAQTAPGDEALSEETVSEEAADSDNSLRSESSLRSENSLRSATLYASPANLRSGAGTNFDVLATLVDLRGSEIDIITDLTNGWYEIAHPEGSGWIFGAFVRPAADGASVVEHVDGLGTSIQLLDADGTAIGDNPTANIALVTNTDGDRWTVLLPDGQEAFIDPDGVVVLE